MTAGGLAVAFAVLFFALPSHAGENSPYDFTERALPRRTAVILVLPGPGAPVPGSGSWRASLDFHAWFEPGRDGPEPGLSLTISRDLLHSPLRVAAFLEGGLFMSRSRRIEERSYEGLAGGETVEFLETVRVRELRTDPALRARLGAGPPGFDFSGWRIDTLLGVGVGLLADRPAGTLDLSLSAGRRFGALALQAGLGAGPWFSDKTCWRISLSTEISVEF